MVAFELSAAAASVGFGGNWAGAGVEGCVALDRRWIELSGDAEREAADRVDGGDAGRDPRCAGAWPEDVDRV
jgi:hypothetical protein